MRVQPRNNRGRPPAAGLGAVRKRKVTHFLQKSPRFDKMLPILCSGFEIAPSFEVSEEGGLYGMPTEVFLSELA